MDVLEFALTVTRKRKVLRGLKELSVTEYRSPTENSEERRLRRRWMIGNDLTKIFYLNRTEDESGVSGTGRVAQGFIFDNGKVAVTWPSEHPSVTVYDNIGEGHAILATEERQRFNGA